MFLCNFTLYYSFDLNIQCLDNFTYLFVFKQNEYYSCDAKYRNWLKFQLENAEVTELSEEENQKAVVAAKETLDSSLSLLLSKWCQAL